MGINTHDRKGDPLHHQRGQSRAAHAQLWRAPMAENQHPAQGQVDQHRPQRNPKHHLRPPQGRKIGFERHHQKRRRHSRPGDAQKVLRQLGHLGLLPQGQKPSARCPKHRIAHKTKAQRQPKRHAGIAAHLGLIPLAYGDCHQGHQGLGKARPKDENDKKARSCQSDRSKFRHAVAPHQHRVSDMQQHPCQMRAHQRQPQRQDRAGMGKIRFDHGAFYLPWPSPASPRRKAGVSHPRTPVGYLGTYERGAFSLRGRACASCAAL